MKPEQSIDAAGELVQALVGLEGLHTELAGVIDRKIDCMKQCDLPGMNATAAREHELVGQIGEAEGRRRMLTDRLARTLGLPPLQARRMTVDQVAAKLAEDRRADLRATAARLRSLTTHIARRNHVAGTLGSRVLRHLDAVFAAMTTPRERAGVYSSVGRKETGAQQQLFEAVG